MLGCLPPTPDQTSHGFQASVFPCLFNTSVATQKHLKPNVNNRTCFLLSPQVNIPPSFLFKTVRPTPSQKHIWIPQPVHTIVQILPVVTSDYNSNCPPTPHNPHPPPLSPQHGLYDQEGLVSLLFCCCCWFVWYLFVWPVFRMYTGCRVR